MHLAVGLSDAVRPSLLKLVERVVDEAWTLGFAFHRKNADERLRPKHAAGSCSSRIARSATVSAEMDAAYAAKDSRGLLATSRAGRSA